MEIKNTLILESNDMASKAASQLANTPAVIITKKGKYFGIIDHRSLESGVHDLSTVKCETLTTKAPTLALNADLPEQIDSFLAGHFKALPVVKDDVPIGITTRVELLSDLKKSGMIPSESVVDLIQKPAYTIDENETIANAKTMMKDKKATRLIVTSKAKFVGVISTFDIAAWSIRSQQGAGRKDKPATSTDVENKRLVDFIRPQTVTIGKNTNLIEAAEIMIKNQISTLIVSEDTSPMGVISAIEIFKRIKEIEEAEPKITISGLEDKSKRQELQDKILHTFVKFERLKVHDIQAHVKEQKSSFIINLTVQTNDGQLNIKDEGKTFYDALNAVADELHTLLRKKKERSK